MTRRRWIADEVSGDLAYLVGEHASHLSRVLRAQVGQEFDIVTPDSVRLGRISSIADSRVEFQLGNIVPSAEIVPITLLLSIFKFDRMEWAIEKCTELGVYRVVPVIARRTEAHLVTAAAKRVERWKRIAKQASEQSRRTSITEIANPAKLQQVLEPQSGFRIVLSELEQNISLKDVISQSINKESPVLAFGPEGGWIQDELNLFEKAGWKSASLGSTILRAETAAIAATAIAISELS